MRKGATVAAIAVMISGCWSPTAQEIPKFTGRDTILFVGGTLDLSKLVRGVEGPVVYEILSGTGSISIMNER